MNFIIWSMTLHCLAVDQLTCMGTLGVRLYLPVPSVVLWFPWEGALSCHSLYLSWPTSLNLCRPPVGSLDWSLEFCFRRFLFWAALCFPEPERTPQRKDSPKIKVECKCLSQHFLQPQDQNPGGFPSLFVLLRNVSILRHLRSNGGSERTQSSAGR